MPPNYYQQSQLHQYQHHQYRFDNAVPDGSSHPIIGMTITTTSSPNPDVITMETRINGRSKDARKNQSDKNSNNYHHRRHHRSHNPPPPPPFEQKRRHTRNQQYSNRLYQDDSSSSDGTCSSSNRSSCSGSNIEIMSLTMMDNNNDTYMNTDDVSCCMSSNDAVDEYENHSYDGCEYGDDDNNVDDRGHTNPYRTNSLYNTMNAAYHEDSYPSLNIPQHQYRRHSNHHCNKKRQQHEQRHSSFMTARILACSSPEITSLLKQSQQPRYNIKSNDSTNTVAPSVTMTTPGTFPPPTDNELSGYQQQLLLPSLSKASSSTCTLRSSTISTGNNNCYYQHRFDDPMDVPSATMTNMSTTTAVTNIPVWAESWLSLSKAQYQQEETKNQTKNTSIEIFVSSSEPCSYNNSSDSCNNSYGMKVTEGTSFTSSSTVGTTPTTIAAAIPPKSMPTKLSLHRRISNDQLPQIDQLQLNDASLTSSATSFYSFDTDNHHQHQQHPPNNSSTSSSGVEKLHLHNVDTNYKKMTSTLPSTSLNKLLLQKSVTIVSDDTNNSSNNS